MEKRFQKRKTGSIIRVAVTGPESTGKTTLANSLAEKFRTVCRQEYARKYIDRLNRPYTYEDVENIAREQCRMEELILPRADRVMIADTDLLVIKVWMNFKYYYCPDWILEAIEANPYDLYLLCDSDFPWEPDSQREHPAFRQQLADIYRRELKNYGFNYRIVSGNPDHRLSVSVSLVDDLVKNLQQENSVAKSY